MKPHYLKDVKNVVSFNSKLNNVIVVIILKIYLEKLKMNEQEQIIDLYINFLKPLTTFLQSLTLMMQLIMILYRIQWTHKN